MVLFLQRLPWQQILRVEKKKKPALLMWCCSVNKQKPPKNILKRVHRFLLKADYHRNNGPIGKPVQNDQNTKSSEAILHSWAGRIKKNSESQAMKPRKIYRFRSRPLAGAIGGMPSPSPHSFLTCEGGLTLWKYQNFFPVFSVSKKVEKSGQHNAQPTKTTQTAWE